MVDEFLVFGYGLTRSKESGISRAFFMVKYYPGCGFFTPLLLVGRLEVGDTPDLFCVLLMEE